MVAIGQRYNVGQLIYSLRPNGDAADSLLQRFLDEYAEVEIIQFCIHFTDLHLLAIQLIVDKETSSEEDTPKQYAFDQFLSLPHDYLLSLHAQVVHQTYSLLPGLATILGQVVLHVAVEVTRHGSDYYPI